MLLELVELMEEESSPSFAAAAATRAAASACAWARMILGAFLRCSLSPSVSGPRPMLVKKLIAYRVLRGTSRGNIPVYHPRCSGSSVSNRSRSFAIPMASAISWTRILTKIREDDVVSSSFRWTADRADHGSESVCSRWANSFATFRSLLVSKRWMVPYWAAKDSRKAPHQRW